MKRLTTLVALALILSACQDADVITTTTSAPITTTTTAESTTTSTTTSTTVTTIVPTSTSSTSTSTTTLPPIGAYIPFDWMDGPSPTCQVLATRELPGPYYLDVVLIAGAMREPYQNEEGQWILPIYYCDNPTSGEPIVVEYLLGGDDVAMGLMQGEDGYVVPYDETKRNKGTMTPVDMTVSAFVKQHLALDELYPLILITETSGLPFPDCLEKDDCRHLVEVFADMAEKHQHLLSLISGERTDPITELIGDIPGIFQAKRYEQ